MKITLDMFRSLCSVFRIDSSFTTCILGMGKKLRPENEHFMNSYAQIHDQPCSPASGNLQVESFSAYLE